MSLDAEAAWRLVLALRHRPCDRHGAADVTVRPDGTWSAEQAVPGDAATILDLYLPLAAASRWVLGHLGQSLDGRIACCSGHSASLTGGANLDHLHRLRALADAVVIGAGTALADDPRLTTRRVAGTSPTRVVVAGRRPLDPGLGLFTDAQAPTLVLRTAASPPLPPDISGEEVAATADGRPDPSAVVAALARRGLHRLFIEGGGQTVSAFFAAGVLDRLQLCIAPLLIGSGVAAVSLPAVATVREAARLRGRWLPMGSDMLFDCPLPTASHSDTGGADARATTSAAVP